MDAILIILICGLGSTLFFSVVLGILKVRIMGSVSVGLLISDIIVGIVHRLDFSKGYYIPSSGDSVLFIYWVISLIYFIMYIIIYSIKYKSNTCVCNCCKHQDYFNLDEQNIWDKLI